MNTGPDYIKFCTDYDTIYGMMDIDNPYVYRPLTVWKGNIYATSDSRYEVSTELRTTDVVLYDLTWDDYHYVYSSGAYTLLHPRQRLLHTNDLEHVPLTGFYSNEHDAVKILHSGLFTLDLQILKRNNPVYLHNTVLSYWEFHTLYVPDPLAEGTFYEHYLSRD